MAIASAPVTGRTRGLPAGLVAALVDVGDEQDGLGCQGLQQRKCIRRVGWGRHGPGGPIGRQGLDRLGEPLRLGDRAPVTAFGRARDPFEARLGLLDVGVDQLGLDRLDVGQRVDPASGWRTLGIFVNPDHMNDRIGLAVVGQELVTQTFTAVSTDEEPGDLVDVVEGDRVGDDLRCPHGLHNGAEPWLGHRTSATWGSIAVNGWLAAPEPGLSAH